VGFASDEMIDSDEYRAKAVEFRAKAKRERDPLFRSMFETLSKRYSRLAVKADQYRDAPTKLAHTPSPLIAAVEPDER